MHLVTNVNLTDAVSGGGVAQPFEQTGFGKYDFILCDAAMLGLQCSAVIPAQGSDAPIS